MLNTILNLKINKKGISPLIATVLLIAFSLTLGGIVMNFSQSSTIELKNQADAKIERGLTCSLDLTISVLEINNDQFVCYNRSGTNNFEVIVENQGSASAQGVRIFLLDYYNNPTTRDSYLPLGSHNRTKYNISLDTTDDGSPFVFPPTKVLISPILSYTTDSVDLCTDNRIDIEEVNECD